MFKRVNFIPPFILMGITEGPLGSAEEWQKVPEQHRCGPQILRSLCYKSGSIPKGNSGAWDDLAEQIQSSLIPLPPPPPKSWPERKMVPDFHKFRSKVFSCSGCLDVCPSLHLSHLANFISSEDSFHSPSPKHERPVHSWQLAFFITHYYLTLCYTFNFLL